MGQVGLLEMVKTMIKVGVAMGLILIVAGVFVMVVPTYTHTTVSYFGQEYETTTQNSPLMGLPILFVGLIVAGASAAYHRGAPKISQPAEKTVRDTSREDVDESRTQG
jgi:uncharacterized protein YjeT (DUF2065 family)